MGSRHLQNWTRIEAMNPLGSWKEKDPPWSRPKVRGARAWLCRWQGAGGAEGRKAAGIDGKGWIYTTHSGAYGSDYLYRAAVAEFDVGENLPQDAIYPTLSSDSENRPLAGTHQYVLHFEKGKLPPVDAFWSVTAYDIEGYFIPNSLKRSIVAASSVPESQLLPGSRPIAFMRKRIG